MAEFYSRFSQNYDYIFPLKEQKVDLLAQTFSSVPGKKLLDIGCGTGSYALALVKRGFRVQGFDLDPEMVELARAKLKKMRTESAGVSRKKVGFSQLNMKEIADQFSADDFSGIYVIGNVLVHLTSPVEIKAFLAKCHHILQPKGKILIQIINYDRILDQDIKGLPTIEGKNGELIFERDYKFRETEKIIDFKTRLYSNKQDRILHESSVPLYPVRAQELSNLLKEVGFKVEETMGDVQGGEFNPESSVPFIITAKNTAKN